MANWHVVPLSSSFDVWDFSDIDMDVRPLLMRYEFHIDDELFLISSLRSEGDMRQNSHSVQL